jgi:hypothetical protein
LLRFKANVYLGEIDVSSWNFPNTIFAESSSHSAGSGFSCEQRENFVKAAGKGDEVLVRKYIQVGMPGYDYEAFFQANERSPVAPPTFFNSPTAA